MVNDRHALQSFFGSLLAGIAWLGIVLGLLFVGLAPARAQQPDTTRPVQIQAHTLRGLTQNGEQVRRLIGNVRLRQGDTRLWAQRATQYLSRQEILFTGEVLIVERGDSLRADTVLYDSQDKVGRARGHVRLTDGKVRVRAPSGQYFARKKHARFDEGLTLVDSLTTITSTTGDYFSRAERAVFQQDVWLRKPDTRLRSDTLVYLREREVAKARGHVLVEHLEEDTTKADSMRTRTLLYGERVYTDEPAGLSRAHGRPLLVQLRPDSADTDTLLIRANQLEAHRADTLRRLVAVDSVRLWQRRLAAVGDSMVYDRRALADDSVRREMRLFQEPIAWQETAQITGDSIRLAGHGPGFDSLFVHRNAFVARRDTLLDRIHQLRGHRLVGRLTQGALRKLGVGPNAEAIYFLTDEQDRPDGAVQASGDSVTFAFQNEEVDAIRVLGGVEGTHYAESQLPSPLRLDGFRWTPDRRPTKEALLQRLPPALRPLPPRQPEPEPLPTPLVRTSPRAFPEPLDLP